MTLITKLEDSEEGLIGITKQGERVHLGKPHPLVTVQNFGYTTYEKIRAVLSFKDIEDMQKDKINKAIKILEDNLDENDKGYYYSANDPFDAWCTNHRYLSFALTYTFFDKAKEDAFKRGAEAYESESIIGKRKYIKIHRVEGEK